MVMTTNLRRQQYSINTSQKRHRVSCTPHYRSSSQIQKYRADRDEGKMEFSREP